MAISVIVLTSILVLDVVLEEDMLEDADAIRNVEAFITMFPTGPNQKGNVVKLYTGPGESRFTDQFFGNLTVYRTAKALRDRISISLYFESDDIDIVRGSIYPMVHDINVGVGTKIEYIPIVASISLTTPMLDYSTGINPLVKVKVWGTWLSQWNAGQENGTWYGGNIEPFYIYVHVVPYHYLQMSFDPAMVDLSPGGSGEIDVIVMNTGNGNERVDLTIPNEKAYAKEGWIFEFNRTSIDIGPRSEGRARITVTAPRSTIKWRMETVDFSVKAISYYDKYQARDEGREEIHSYEMTFMVYIFGLDFTYVPWAWAAMFYVVLFVILLNSGIWPLTMRKRKLPRGKEPPFVALYHYTQSPERRARVDAIRAEKRRLKLEDRERKKAVKDIQREMDSRDRAMSKEREISRERPRAKVLDLKKVDDDFDIELPEIRKPEVKTQKKLGIPASSDDDFDIRIDEPVERKRSTPRKPLFAMRPKASKKPERSEEDLRDALKDL